MAKYIFILKQSDCSFSISMRGRNLELIHNLIVEYRRVLFNCLAGPACNHYILQEIGWERGGGGNGGS